MEGAVARAAGGADARHHLAAACEELDAARRRCKALGEAEDACRRAKENTPGERAELADVESGLQALNERANQDVVQAEETANEALNAVESLNWRHRLTGNPCALWGMLVALVAAISWLLGMFLLPNGWSDGLVRFPLAVVLLAALILSQRGWARSYKRGRLPEKDEGVLPLRGAATTGRWVSAFVLIGVAGSFVVGIYAALLRWVFNYELGGRYTEPLFYDDLVAILRSETFPALVFSSAVLASIGVKVPGGNLAQDLARIVSTAIAGVGRWVWRRLLIRRAPAPEATRTSPEDSPTSCLTRPAPAHPRFRTSSPAHPRPAGRAADTDAHLIGT